MAERKRTRRQAAVLANRSFLRVGLFLTTTVGKAPGGMSIARTDGALQDVAPAIAVAGHLPALTDGSHGHLLETRVTGGGGLILGKLPRLVVVIGLVLGDRITGRRRTNRPWRWRERFSAT